MTEAGCVRSERIEPLFFDVAERDLSRGRRRSRRARRTSAEGPDLRHQVQRLRRRALAEMIDRHCREARLLVAGIRDASLEVANRVVLNPCARARQERGQDAQRPRRRHIRRCNMARTLDLGRAIGVPDQRLLLAERGQRHRAPGRAAESCDRERCGPRRALKATGNIGSTDPARERTAGPDPTGAGRPVRDFSRPRSVPPLPMTTAPFGAMRRLSIVRLLAPARGRYGGRIALFLAAGQRPTRLLRRGSFRTGRSEISRNPSETEETTFPLLRRSIPGSLF